ncbi:MAG: hypothetical protein NVS1B13_06480 [Flavisolibacter sp.]
MASCALAQTDTTLKINAPKASYQSRANDHFMFQVGYTNWNNKPDSIHTTGLPRTFNFYVMLDFPFKTNPHLSVAIGPGVSSDNIFFNKTYIGLKDHTTTIRFQDLSDTSHFKKYKLNTTYLEVPVELRFRSNPDNDAKSVKFALGAKVAYLINAHTKGKTFLDKTGKTLFTYIDKQSSTAFFNTTRLSGEARLGYGHFSLFATYAITSLFKDGFGPQVHPVTFGISLSGL